MERLEDMKDTMKKIENIQIILASASPRRRELLGQIGLHPQILPSTVEENITSTKPEEVVKELSWQKAEDVFDKIEGERRENTGSFVVIGADTVVANAGEILGKPKSHADAARMIEELQGKEHQVYTGVTLIGRDADGKRVQTVFAEKTDVFVYPMNEEEIYEYANSEEPMDKAGAYGIQGRFAAYIERICGDYNNVVGLPAGRVFQEIKRLF